MIQPSDLSRAEFPARPDGDGTLPTSPARRRLRALVLVVASALFGAGWSVLDRLQEGSTMAEALRFILWIFPAVIVFELFRRFRHSLGAGGGGEYDYSEMNPLVRRRVLSPVPYLGWERYKGCTVIADAVSDRFVFMDTLALGIDLTTTRTPAQLLELLETLRPAASHWEQPRVHRDPNLYALHAVFDAPPPWANAFTADYGARIWASVRDNGDGSCRLRVVLGPGGFGQGQLAELLTSLLPPSSQLLEASTGFALKLEAELRGAVAWFASICSLLDLGQDAAQALHGAKLYRQLVSDVPVTVEEFRPGFVIGAVAASVALFTVLTIFAMLLG